MLVSSKLESVIEQMAHDVASGKLSFPGVRERIVPLEGHIKTLKYPWKGCGFGQQAVDKKCSKLQKK